jgi:aspartyl protease family protein
MDSGAKHALREALIWASVALAGLALFYFYDDLATAFHTGVEAGGKLAKNPSSEGAAHVSRFDSEVRLSADARGHFVVEAEINSRPVTLVADTGATLVVLSFEDAERLGLSPKSLDFSGVAQTANGAARVAPLTLAEVRLGDIAVRDVPAAIAERGALPINLLGMSFLGRLKSFEMKGRELVLVQ